MKKDFILKEIMQDKNLQRELLAAGSIQESYDIACEYIKDICDYEEYEKIMMEMYKIGSEKMKLSDSDLENVSGGSKNKFLSVCLSGIYIVSSLTPMPTVCAVKKSSTSKTSGTAVSGTDLRETRRPHCDHKSLLFTTTRENPSRLTRKPAGDGRVEADPEDVLLRRSAHLTPENERYRKRIMDLYKGPNKVQFNRYVNDMFSPVLRLTDSSTIIERLERYVYDCRDVLGMLFTGDKNVRPDLAKSAKANREGRMLKKSMPARDVIAYSIFGTVGRPKLEKNVTEICAKIQDFYFPASRGLKEHKEALSSEFYSMASIKQILNLLNFGFMQQALFQVVKENEDQGVKDKLREFFGDSRDPKKELQSINMNFIKTYGKLKNTVANLIGLSNEVLLDVLSAVNVQESKAFSEVKKKLEKNVDNLMRYCSRYRVDVDYGDDSMVEWYRDFIRKNAVAIETAGKRVRTISDDIIKNKEKFLEAMFKSEILDKICKTLDEEEVKQSEGLVRFDCIIRAIQSLSPNNYLNGYTFDDFLNMAKLNGKISALLRSADEVQKSVILSLMEHIDFVYEKIKDSFLEKIKNLKIDDLSGYSKFLVRWEREKKGLTWTIGDKLEVPLRSSHYSVISQINASDRVVGNNGYLDLRSSIPSSSNPGQVNLLLSSSLRASQNRRNIMLKEVNDVISSGMSDTDISDILNVLGEKSEDFSIKDVLKKIIDSNSGKNKNVLCAIILGLAKEDKIENIGYFYDAVNIIEKKPNAFNNVRSIDEVISIIKNEMKSTKPVSRNLKNLTSTYCFVNSAIQLLFRLDGLRDEVKANVEKDEVCSALNTIFEYMHPNSTIGDVDLNKAYEKLDSVFKEWGREKYDSTSSEDMLQIYQCGINAQQTQYHFMYCLRDKSAVIKKYTVDGMRELGSTEKKDVIVLNYDNMKKIETQIDMNGQKYELNGLSCHTGSVEGGHYIAYVNDGKWIEMNDTDRTEYGKEVEKTDGTVWELKNIEFAALLKYTRIDDGNVELGGVVEKESDKGSGAKLQKNKDEVKGSELNIREWFEKLKDENKIDAKKVYSDEILALIKRISENMPTLCDEDQKEYDRFKVLNRIKMSSEIQELLAKNERKDIDKAKIYIYYIKWICVMGGYVQFDKTTNDELGNIQEALDSLKKG